MSGLSARRRRLLLLLVAAALGASSLGSQVSQVGRRRERASERVQRASPKADSQVVMGGGAGPGGGEVREPHPPERSSLVQRNPLPAPSADQGALFALSPAEPPATRAAPLLRGLLQGTRPGPDPPAPSTPRLAFRLAGRRNPIPPHSGWRWASWGCPSAGLLPSRQS